MTSKRILAEQVLTSYAFMTEIETVEEFVPKDIKDNQERRLQAKRLLFDSLQESVMALDAVNVLSDFIIKNWHSCPFKAEEHEFFESCVGFRENGCKECLLEHISELN